VAIAAVATEFDTENHPAPQTVENTGDFLIGGYFRGKTLELGACCG
jgi:hypothetical protein